MYRTIDTKFWTDPKVRKLDPLGKLMALYLVTNPHAHLGGIYYLSDHAVIAETGISRRNLDTLWDTLSDSGFAIRDTDLDIVWVIRMFKYQGCGDKHERSVANHLRSLHNSRLVKDFLEQYPSVSKHFSDTPSDRASRFGTQEQEKEKEKEQDTNTTKKKFVKPTVDEVKAYCLERKNGIDPQTFVDHYEANGWRRGKTPVKDWKACVRTWEHNRKESTAAKAEEQKGPRPMTDCEVYQYNLDAGHVPRNPPPPGFVPREKKEGGA